jgi:hypothetical protein
MLHCKIIVPLLTAFTEELIKLNAVRPRYSYDNLEKKKKTALFCWKSFTRIIGNPTLSEINNTPVLNNTTKKLLQKVFTLYKAALKVKSQNTNFNHSFTNRKDILKKTQRLAKQIVDLSVFNVSTIAKRPFYDEITLYRIFD